MGWISRPPRQAHDVVADLLEAQTSLHQLGVVLGHLHRILIAEKVGGVQHEQMEGVALDPLATVDESAQQIQGAGDLHSAGVLHSLGSAQQIGDRADPADAGRDVRCLGEVAAAQQSLEEPGRLKNLEPDLFYSAIF